MFSSLRARIGKRRKMRSRAHKWDTVKERLSSGDHMWTGKPSVTCVHAHAWPDEVNSVPGQILHVSPFTTADGHSLSIVFGLKRWYWHHRPRSLQNKSDQVLSDEAETGTVHQKQITRISVFQGLRVIRVGSYSRGRATWAHRVFFLHARALWPIHPIS
jgi:hypothetical protein